MSDHGGHRRIDAKRRTWLTRTGLLGFVLLAGCLGDGESDSANIADADD